MIANEQAANAAEAVKLRPELAPGLEHFEADKPVSQGSGSAVLGHGSF
jgi:hypothetical protein